MVNITHLSANTRYQLCVQCHGDKSHQTISTIQCQRIRTKAQSKKFSISILILFEFHSRLVEILVDPLAYCIQSDHFNHHVSISTVPWNKLSSFSYRWKRHDLSRLICRKKSDDTPLVRACFIHFLVNLITL